MNEKREKKGKREKEKEMRKGGEGGKKRKEIGSRLDRDSATVWCQSACESSQSARSQQRIKLFDFLTLPTCAPSFALDLAPVHIFIP